MDHGAALSRQPFAVTGLGTCCQNEAGSGRNIRQPQQLDQTCSSIRQHNSQAQLHCGLCYEKSRDGRKHVLL